MINDVNGEGSPPVVVAGNQSVASYTMAKCNKALCKTCPFFSTSKSVLSNVTKKSYNIKNPSGENLSCKSANVVYLLTCEHCNFQYVGETATPLKDRISRHRTAKLGCRHVLNHYKENCVGTSFSFSVQILEKLTGSGYKDGKIDPEMRDLRLKSEDFWMKALRTIYPYGLNERAKKHDDEISVGKLYPPLSRSGDRACRSRANRNNRYSSVSTDSFFDSLQHLLTNDLKSCLNTIRKLLNNTKKKVLKEIASSLLNDNLTFNFHPNREQCFHFILDIIDTKLYTNKVTVKKKTPPKNICTVDFKNKALENIRLSSIFNLPECVNLLPDKLKSKDENPVIVYKLGSTIRNKILNYKETVESIFIDDEVSFINNAGECNCLESNFCDPHHKHIITGDLRIVQNSKLRKLLTKGPNYREPRTLNFHKCKSAITSGLDECIDNLSSKYKIDSSNFQAWKNLILQKVEDKIQFLKARKTIIPTKPVLSDPEVLTYLEELQRHFVIVPIDKASNNFAFICKKYYVSIILKEVGLSDLPNSTYEKSNLSIREIVENNIKFCERFGLKISEQQLSLPLMYWSPKMHKNPVGKRFIIASKQCSTKPLSQVISLVFKLIFNTVNSFHNKNLFYSNLNKFWVVQNSFPITNKLDKINFKNNARCISTFDFSTLYTKIPHNLLVKVLNEIIDFVFKGSIRNKIGFTTKSVYWTNKGVGKRFFTRESLKEAVEYLITKCYFSVGNCVFIQKIGIPMGIDPAPFWANLFLYKYECKHVSTLASLKDIRSFRYHSMMRFIDDLCAINDGGEFGNSFKDIYPPELELKVEHNGSHATFLDLDITIINNKFVYKLFDKRDAFNFFIVRMPDLSSNIPSTVFYGSVLSEFLRIARYTLLYNDFIPKARDLYQRMITQGGNVKLTGKQISKAFSRHPEAFLKFQKTPIEIINEITAGQ